MNYVELATFTVGNKEVFKAAGISPEKYSILALLQSRKKSGATAQEIREYIGIDQNRSAQHVRALLDKKWIKRSGTVKAFKYEIVQAGTLEIKRVDAAIKALE